MNVSLQCATNQQVDAVGWRQDTLWQWEAGQQLAAEVCLAGPKTAATAQSCCCLIWTCCRARAGLERRLVQPVERCPKSPLWAQERAAECHQLGMHSRAQGLPSMHLKGRGPSQMTAAAAGPECAAWLCGSGPAGRCMKLPS